MSNPVLGTMIWDPVQFRWVPQTTAIPPVQSSYVGSAIAGLETSDIVGGQVNYAGMTIAALQPVNIVPTTKLVNNGNFVDLDVAGDAVFHGKVFFNRGVDTRRYDCSPTSGAVVYLDMNNGTSQYLLLKRDLTVWLPSIGQRESTLSLLVEQDATGGWVITWRINAAIDGSAPFPWPEGQAPVMNLAPGAVETFSFSWCGNLNDGQGGYATELWNRLTAEGVLSGNLARASVTADKLYAGTITSYLVNVVNRLRGCTVKFWEPSLNHVSWIAGTVTLAKATYTTLSGQDPSTADVTWGTIVLSISAGAYGTVLSAASTYYAYVTYAVDAYGEPASIGSVTFATSYPTGLYDIVLAIITCDAVGHIAVEVVNVAGTIINGDHIATGTITASKIAAGTITADKLSAAYIQVGGAEGDITTISGAKITTGTISITKLNFTPLSSSNIIASINASAEGIRIAGAKINIDGTVTFASGYNPTGKIPVGGAEADITTISGAKIVTGSITANKLAVSFIQVGGAATDVNAGSTTISGGKITTGTITADKLTVAFLQVGGAAADVNAGGTTISGAKITTGTITANAIQVGTLTGFSIISASGATRMEMTPANGGQLSWFLGNANLAGIYLDTLGHLAISSALLTIQGPSIFYGQLYLNLGVSIGFGGMPLQRIGGDLYWGSTKLN